LVDGRGHLVARKAVIIANPFYFIDSTDKSCSDRVRVAWSAKKKVKTAFHSPFSREG